MILGSYGNGAENISRIYVWADSLTWLGVPLVLCKWFNQMLCDRYFTDLILGSFGNRPVNKSRYHVLAVLLLLLRNHYIIST